MFEILSNFFQLSPIPSYQILGVYDLHLVLLSFLVAMFASYIALDITGRLRDVGTTPLSISLWLFGGAFAMGAGIWSMHFIGMLAFTMEGMPVIYDPYWTGLSMVVAIFASGFAFLLLKEIKINWTRITMGGVIMGIAIASMHYTGMAAMRGVVSIHYLPGLFALSILIAILASEAALWLALKSNQALPRLRFRLKLISAFVMGAAICGMHYVGMAAAVFTSPAICIPIAYSLMLDPDKLALIIAAATFVVLGVAVIASSYKEAQNQLLLAKARQAGMSEVASSVLHNVGNVLNSINITTVVIAEKISQSKLSTLIDLNDLLQQHKDELDIFLTEDKKGKEVLKYISILADYWRKEQTELLNEIEILFKNIEHIKNTVALQQSLSKTRFDQITSITSVIEEALFICGLDNAQKIKIKKSFASLKPILIDKVKLLQILINIIRNAKDAITEAKKEDQRIIITTKLTDNTISIRIEDNGVGITANQIKKIFSYGYTTKESGHGYGIHSSAIAAKELGGSLQVTSNGEGKGAVFTLIIPNILPT